MGHNHVWVSKVGRWFSRREGGPLVLTGEEIVSEHYHLLAIGIDSTIDWRQTAVRAIEPEKKTSESCCSRGMEISHCLRRAPRCRRR